MRRKYHVVKKREGDAIGGVASNLARTGRVLLRTNSKIFPFSDLARDGKLTVPDVPMVVLTERFDSVLVEVEGSAHHPFKVHASYETVILPAANQTICVAGPSASDYPSGRRPTGRNCMPAWMSGR